MRYLRSALRRIALGSLFHLPVADARWCDALYERHSRKRKPGTIAYDLGSGPSPRNPFACETFKGIDIRSGADVIQADLTSGVVPLESDSVDAFSAFDFFEHVPRVLGVVPPAGGVRFPFVQLMGELFRCLKPGGIILSATPGYPWPMVFQDPTHVNIMTEDTLPRYFCGPVPGASMYGFTGRFDVADAAWVGNHCYTLLTKPAD